jgi:type IV pilus assembly protein PilW
VVHNTGNVKIGPGNCTKDLGQTYLGGRILKLHRAIYFVADTGRGVPALYRTDEAGTPQELVEGVEQMQVLFGVGSDTDNDGVVDAIQYLRADEIRDAPQPQDVWSRVVTARVHLLMQSTDRNVLWQAQPVDYSINVTAGTSEYHVWDLEPTDKSWRQVYAMTVTVRNRVQ